MSEGKGKFPITQEQIMKVLDVIYQKAQGGVKGVSPSVKELAQSYLNKQPDIPVAAKNMIRNQVLKCATSGFITGFGGIVTLPVTVPANVGSVLYVQMRMVACTAFLAGYDMDSDQTQTFIYACLAGVSINEIVKKTGIKIAQSIATTAVKKIPGAALTKINQKVGFRLLTKFGEKGLINFGKLIPVAGAVVSGGFDLAETRIIGNRAYRWFFEGDFSEKKAAGDKNNARES
ncbi:EcsC family protein [Scardovia wiggsiae]|uniref:EcsC family protein n=1 Tax=Scardovia wiggsiae TaxID=230143 RepID=UPI00374F56FD